METRGRSVPGRAGVVLGTAVGVPLLLVGLLGPGGQVVLPAAVPVFDAAAIFCLLLTAVVAGVDAAFSRQRGPLPTIAVSLAAVVLWTAHFVLFPGNLPLSIPGGSEATSSVFLGINLAMPLMLGLALLQDRGSIQRPSRAIVLAGGWGLAVGAVVAAVAILASGFFPTIAPDGRFNATSAWLGGASLVPAAVALAIFLSGRRGDERVGGGIVAALILQGCNSILLLFLVQRYTTGWYVDHTLSLLTAISLLAGQMVIFTSAMRREQLSVVALRTSLEMAETLARESDLGSMIQKLMEGAMAAVEADRATLMTLDDEELTIEACIDRRGTPAPIGHRLPVGALQVDGRQIVPETMRSARPIPSPAYDVNLLDPAHASSVDGIRHYITWPLFLGGKADAVLFLARRSDVPFGSRDTELLSEFATIAALLLRNARLLRAAEAASLAKSSFLNLAGHELRTPLAVIGGYIDLLAARDLGPVNHFQADVLDTLRAKLVELGRHVNQLLTVSRLDGLPQLSDMEAELPLRAACEAAIERARARSSTESVTFELAPGAEVSAAGSPTAVALILDKLVENAVTYSPSPARVRMEVDERTPAILVSDSGIGIPPEEHSNVFDQFHRVDRPDFGYPSGIGLGLFLARQHALAMGGRLLLEHSEVGAGSTFRLELGRPARRTDAGGRGREGPSELVVP